MCSRRLEVYAHHRRSASFPSPPRLFASSFLRGGLQIACVAWPATSAAFCRRKPRRAPFESRAEQVESPAASKLNRNEHTHKHSCVFTKRHTTAEEVIEKLLRLKTQKVKPMYVYVWWKIIPRGLSPVLVDRWPRCYRTRASVPSEAHWGIIIMRHELCARGDDFILFWEGAPMQ